MVDKRTYRLPPAWKSRIAPTIDGSTALSRYGRGGVAVERYMRFKVDGFASMALLISPLLTVKLGGGVDYAKPFDIAMTEIEVPEGAEPREREPVENSGLLRALSRVEASFNFDRRVLRRDQRDELRMLLKAGSSPTGAWIVDWRFWSQVISNFGPHELVLRSRGVFLAGDVKFWEEVPLASSYQRAYFGNRFWVRQALQISVAGRFALGRTIKVGLFHDLSAFFDRSRLPEESDLAEALGPLAFANGFGPSLHFLLFDHFALDLFYAFGFAPGGFDHNFSLRMQSAF